MMYKSMASQHLYHMFNVPAELGNLIDPKESFCVAECILSLGMFPTGLAAGLYSKSSKS